MIFLEDYDLIRLRSILNDFDAIDKHIDVHLELLCISNSEDLQTSTNNDNNKISLPNSAESIYIYLIMVMNKCFPDYDFSSLNDSNFKIVKPIGTVLSTIDYKLSFIVDRILLNFSNDLWNTIKKIISLNETEVYTYESGPEEDPFNVDRSLNSFNYFFYDKSQCKILFFSCVTKSKSLNQTKDPDDELSIAEESSAVRNFEQYAEDSSGD